jgi:glycosyltransferase involved in cell wall biosynthesis
MSKQVVSLVKYDRRGASSRVRFWNLVPELRKRGWDIAVHPLLSDDILSRFYARGRHGYAGLVWHLLKRIKTLVSMGTPKIIWVEKEILPGLPGGLEKMVAGSWGDRLVVDYDDAVFLNYSDAWAGQLGRTQKFKDYARDAACITVGSESLNEQMISWGCARTKRIPSTVDVGLYPVHRHQDSRPVVIGWIGTPRTVHFLEHLRDVFPVVARKFDLQIRIIGASWSCPGVDVRTVPWTKETEAAAVSSLDIGVMPLFDGPWERAKCGYKLIQYMAAGVVPVGADIGENRVVIREGFNGYLASEPADWVEKLSRLCGDVRLRAAIGEKARETALERYDVRVAVEAMDGIFSEVVRRSEEDSR